MATKKYTFYRPHKRVQEHGELVNAHTGDITIPPSMTKQEFVRECDVNNVIKLFSRTGQFTHVSARAAQGAYLDLPDSYDFQESLHTVMAAETAFMTLPAKVRERFHNEPAEFLAFVGDPANGEELISLGLRHPPPPPKEVPNGGGDGGSSPPVDGSKAS